jgi:hypothetical protein
MNISKKISATILGALLLAGCGTTQLRSEGPSNPVGGELSKALTSSKEEVLARGLLPGADLSRDAFSQDGNWTVFCSQDASLVAGDTNGQSDVFLYNRPGNYVVRASLSADGAEANGPCWRASCSSDGRYVVFDSTASNLVPGDTNARSDVFRKDLQTGAVVLVSSSTSGVSNGVSDQAVISNDGRYVAFRSSATNLVANDNNRAADIFLRDVQTGTTTVVSVGANRASANPSISGDGRYVSFDTTSTNLITPQGSPGSGRSNVFILDLQTNGLQWSSGTSTGQEGAGQSHSGHLARDGSVVAFVSSSQLTSAGSTLEQIYVRPVSFAGSTTLVSKAQDGTPANGACRVPVATANGGHVAYLTRATNLFPGKTDSNFDAVLTERGPDLTTRTSNPNGANDASVEQLAVFKSPFISNPVTAFRSLASTITSGDVDGDDDIFLDRRDAGLLSISPLSISDRQTHRIQRQAETGTSIDGLANSPAASSTTGRYVAFTTSLALVLSDVNSLSDVYVLDRATGQYDLVSTSTGGQQGNQNSFSQSISGDGRFVVFESFATNLVSGATSGNKTVYLRDRQLGQTTLACKNTSGVQANSSSYWPRISRDGEVITYSTAASDIVSNDTNAKVDVFAYHRTTNFTYRVSVSSTGVQANNHSQLSSISADGRYIAYESTATNLAGADTNGKSDIYVTDRQTGIRSRVSLDGSGNQLASDSILCDISSDGQKVSYATLTAAPQYYWVRDLNTGLVRRTQLSWAETCGIADLSDDGSKIAYGSNNQSNVGGGPSRNFSAVVEDLPSSTFTLVESWNAPRTDLNSQFVAATLAGDASIAFFFSNSQELVPEFARTATAGLFGYRLSP